MEIICGMLSSIREQVSKTRAGSTPFRTNACCCHASLQQAEFYSSKINRNEDNSEENCGNARVENLRSKKMRTPVEIWTSFRMTSGDQCSAFLTSSATTINVPNPKKRREKYIHSELVAGKVDACVAAIVITRHCNCCLSIISHNSTSITSLGLWRRISAPRSATQGQEKRFLPQRENNREAAICTL